MRNPRPTIVTIALACGVTDGTVSRALRGDPRVKAETRDRVVEAARRLGYRPDLAARALKQGRSGLIGVVCDSGSWMFYNDYFGRLLAGLADAAEADQRRLLFYLPKINPSADLNPLMDEVSLGGLRDLDEGRVEAGVLVGGRLPRPTDLSALRASKVPLVLLSPNEPVAGFAQLLSGADQRMQEAGRLLQARAHRRVGFFGLYAGSTFHASSLRGLKKGLGRGGQVWVETPETWDLNDPALLGPALDRLLAAKVSAIVTANADQALVFQDLLAARPGRPPAIKFLSFGPVPASARARRPRLTVLDADLIHEGQAAYGLLKAVLAGERPRTRNITWTLVPGGETL